MQAAIGLAQLEKIEGFVAARRRNFKLLYSALLPLSDRLVLPEACCDSAPSWFGFPILCRVGVAREKIVRYLEGKGVQTRMLFAGNIVRQPCMEGVEYRVIGGLANTDTVMNDLFWIGVYPGLSVDTITYMSDMLKAAADPCLPGAT